ncbi:hypothetical protein LOZ53_004628 [Ophidiomyces ophidiicola]|uniref:Uncharacterized protein n=1 Tax=Ophidiomyces ophidiicola TaxID=1387563 RepID=A0ACB8UQU9_9EURO|nr:uncharacterized protein LOZ57_001125 [Ophidiomyces ophidiicola]KAI1908011.1 hypothetical protein LOZ64_005693 [Ophidiomyces ophidiicola]KAI1916905.1 hypothetical protein LOZ61_000808 [Ophidiomyces ophidiicola]KAI1922511.1 hypothetical protein LOZ60_005628 [Ophidiomyces ophidiicola]KAI1948651.1 hypothetical protein LOZ62_002600 [Ophidiomyces ophidiicola]KAI1951549.1 hypothetical protein LOZ59_005585 [Ophidiomyces ophidiicola]
MNQDSSLAAWSDHMPDESILSAPSEDFTNLLDFTFDLTDLENAADQNGQAITTAASQASVSMVRDTQLIAMEGIQTSQPQQYPPSSFVEQMPPIGLPAASSMQQVNPSHFYIQKQRQQTQDGIVPQVYNQFVPPTPNSTELHGGIARHPPPLDTGIQRRYEPYTRATEDQSAFTPLISPAMTPLEQQLRFPEYATPGEYLTPLTSPALEAHHPHGNGFMFNPAASMEMGFMVSQPEMKPPLPASTAPSSPAIIRRHRRKSSLVSKPNSRLLRQSPSMRPMSSRQRSHPGSAILSGNDSRIWNKDSSQDPSLASKRVGSHHGSSNESSGQDSVSPEPLAEPLMPPPAIPRAFKSPFITARDPSMEQKSMEAATPATLMNLPKQASPIDPSVQFSRTGSVIVCNVPEEAMEDITLPEPATNVDPAATVTSSTLTGINQPTPKLTSKRTPVLRSLNDISGPGTASVTPSPQIGAMKSPMGPVGLKRTDTRPGGRTSKKRQSASTSQISPALRPKISPSIQPLIRGEGLSSETSALYLASKSNYQHILEGTLLPGVIYPEALAENLSSKRTNHKLAEQGRRNRINTALKEIESLLPPYLAYDKSKDKDKDKNAEGGAGSSKPDKPASHQPISKASTVELAIVYIKTLEKELSETKKKLEEAEKKLQGATSKSTACTAGANDGSDQAKTEASPRSTTTVSTTPDVAHAESGGSETTR